MTQPIPVPVILDPQTVQNFANAAKPPQVKGTIIKTYLLDAAGVLGGTGKWVQICDYEPKRVRMLIKPIDQPVALTLESPVTSPDTSSATVAPQGGHLATTTDQGYEFFGPDAMWLNSLNTTTRVLVIKEYC